MTHPIANYTAQHVADITNTRTVLNQLHAQSDSVRFRDQLNGIDDKLMAALRLLNEVYAISQDLHDASAPRISVVGGGDHGAR